jgi:hypothetical protein
VFGRGPGFFLPELRYLQDLLGNGIDVTGLLTQGAFSDILLVSKATLCRWVKEGKLVGNGKQGRQIRLSKTSVLLAKQDMEEQQLRQDVQDLRKDARKTGF